MSRDFGDGFDYADYLHEFADDAWGCNVGASATVHRCADRITALSAENERLTAELAQARVTIAAFLTATNGETP